MGILSTLQRNLPNIGLGLQIVGNTGRPQVQQGLLANMQAQQEKARMQQAYGGLLQSGNFTPEQRGLLSALPPEAGLGLVAPSVFPKPADPLKPTSLMQNLEAAGYRPGTPEYQALVERAVTKPMVSVDTGFKVPAGFQRDPKNKDRVIPIPGGPQDPKSSSRKRPVGEAQTISAARTALGEMEGVKEKLFSADGRLNRGLLLQGSEVLGVEGVPFTEGRGIRQRVERSIETVLRAKSGAAVPDSEIARFMSMYFPSPLDSDRAALRKVKSLEDFLSGTLSELDAGGGDQASQEDLEFTAKKHGISVEEVKRRLGNAP